MSKSNEVFWWSLFSAGGVMAALFIPAIMLTSGFLLPTRDPELARQRYERLHGVVGWWPVRLLLLVVIVLALFHCAHRVRHVLMDLGLRRRHRLVKAACYLGALAGSVAASVVLAGL